mmetsp:Transcript_20067/g.42831  ORF Transcript_20067/g.42831 Transcript_20067/m.42831 type:complete len:134 (-) Transcript_20067:546-947(-)
MMTLAIGVLLCFLWVFPFLGEAVVWSLTRSAGLQWQLMSQFQFRSCTALLESNSTCDNISYFGGSVWKEPESYVKHVAALKSKTNGTKTATYNFQGAMGFKPKLGQVHRLTEEGGSYEQRRLWVKDFARQHFF